MWDFPETETHLIDFDGLVQDSIYSSALEKELLQPCTKQSIWYSV